MRTQMLLSLLPLVPLVGCALQSPDSERASDRLRTELDEDWKYWMTQYPELATAFGYPGQNARWTDYSLSAIAARADRLKQTAARLAAIDRLGLDASDQLDYDLYRDLLQTAIAGLEFHNDALPIRGVVPRSLLMPMNQLEGVALDVPRTISLMPTASREDYGNIVARLESVGDLVDQTIALMEQGLAQRMTPPAVAVRDLPAQVRAQLVEDPLQSPMLEPFSEWPPYIAEPERAELRARAADAYRRHVRPAFTRLHDFLVSRYLPACRDAVAVSALPNGAAMYAYNVRWHVTTDDTPQQIHQTGLAELRRIRQEMDAIIASTRFEGSFADFKRFLRTDPRFFFADEASLLAAYRDIAKRAEPRLAPLFGRLPRTPYGVEAIPAAIAPSQTTAYYEPGSFAAGRPANMFANTYKLDSRPSWEMTALTLHEAVPGHHLQIALAQELEGLPEFRKNSSYTAYVEGWGLYAESLGEEMGLYKDPYARFGRLTYDAWRAVRLVVDTGLHSMGWTRDRAIDFFRENTAKTDQDIGVEVDRYIVWPGQALGYKMGEIRIRRLRAKAERELGTRFDVRGFHDVVLAEGAVPMDVLERQVDAWIAGVLRANRS